MVNVIICDDNEKDRIAVKKIVDRHMKKIKKDCKIYDFKDYNKKFYDLMNNKVPFRIYLLDIETPSKSGIDVAREIRKKDIDSIIIFLTAHEELGSVVLKNDLLFLSFINKFDDFENRLVVALEKSLELLNQKNTIRFQDRNVVYTININDILYITKESFERKTIIKTDYSEFKINKAMHKIISMLDDRFIQTHRACFVNSTRVTTINKNKKIITFDNGEQTDLLSDKYRKGISV